MMTKHYILPLLPLVLSVAVAQMPSSFDASGKSAQAESGVVDNRPANGEPVNPQLLGMEIPLLDPASDTVTYNGGKFDVGNNALLRARFEKYLHQMPDDSAEAKRYRERMAEILKVTQRSGKTRASVGSEVLVKVGLGLYEIAEYPGDDGQAGTLASAIVSALDAHRANRSRDKNNEKLNKDIDKLVRKTNNYNNRNTHRSTGAVTGGIQGPARHANAPKSNEYVIGVNTKDIAAKEAVKVKNEAANEANIAMAKINYQSVLVSFLMQRRFDHAVIGARAYRHIFRDGDTKLDLKEDSDANKLFVGVGGMPPTVNSIDSLASNARRDVDRNIEAVHSLLAQNKLADATQHLIEAVAIGEYMTSVMTFPVEARWRISQYWDLRKRSLTALNARDYGTVEEIADKMKEMDADFDDSMLRSYCAGKMRQSDLCIRNAMKALQAGNEEEFNKQITEAGIIWPRNPNLDKGAEQLAQLDNQDPAKAEFSQLLKDGEFRRIFDNQSRYEVAAIDPELRDKYKEVITLVSTIDVMLTELASAAEHDKVMGPCMAYEKLLARRKADARFAADDKFRDALHNYAVQAHDFVKVLEDAAECEQRREYGSALSCYYRAQCLYPASDLAKEGVERVTDIILKANY